jgi:hypothetical protein
MSTGHQPNEQAELHAELDFAGRRGTRDEILAVNNICIEFEKKL